MQRRQPGVHNDDVTSKKSVSLRAGTAVFIMCILFLLCMGALEQAAKFMAARLSLATKTSKQTTEVVFFKLNFIHFVPAQKLKFSS